MDTEIITQIFELCIIPLLAILTKYIIKFVQAKTNKLHASTDNEIAKKYMGMIAETIVSCVTATNQTYVETLKTQGKFDETAQKVAFETTLDAVVKVLSDDAKDYIKETTNDLDTYLTELIEAAVNNAKK